MSDYYIKDGELYHYGVKGMKWGVLRERKLRARDAYRLSERTKLDIQYRDKLQKQRNAQKFKGKSTAKIDLKIKQRNIQIKNQEKLYKKLVKDLDQKTIDAGKRYVQIVERHITGGLIGEAIGQARLDKRIRNAY